VSDWDGQQQVALAQLHYLSGQFADAELTEAAAIAQPANFDPVQVVDLLAQ